MLGHDPFSYTLIKSYTAALGTLFNDIDIVRPDGEKLRIPLNFGSKRKWYALLQQRPDPAPHEEPSIILPRLGFNLISVTPAPERQFDRQAEIRIQKDSSTYQLQKFPSPWNFEYEIYVMTKTHGDAHQILEQILPFFAPDFTITATNLTGMGDNRDLPVILGSPAVDDTYEGSFPDAQQIMWTIPFTLHGYLYGPIREQGLIREIQIDFGVVHSDDNVLDAAERAATPRIARITVVPDPIGAAPDDVYTTDVTIEEFYDQKKYDPVTDTDIDL